MATVTIHEAKTHLSRLVADVEAGKEVILARGNKPVAKIVPLNPLPKKKRVAGRLCGQVRLDDSFWEPLPAEELARWNGEAE